MPDESKNSTLNQAEAVDRVWELAESIHTAILISWDGQWQRARPMAATVKRGEHAIYFLADEASMKLDEVARYPRVSAVFADGTKFVTIAGTATVTDDRARIAQLWTPFAKAWWDSADDPAIRVITLVPNEAELWDSPNKLVAGAIMLSAAVTGAKPFAGDHAQVKV